MGLFKNPPHLHGLVPPSSTCPNSGCRLLPQTKAKGTHTPLHQPGTCWPRCAASGLSVDSWRPPRPPHWSQDQAGLYFSSLIFLAVEKPASESSADKHPSTHLGHGGLGVRPLASVWTFGDHPGRHTEVRIKHGFTSVPESSWLWRKLHQKVGGMVYWPACWVAYKRKSGKAKSSVCSQWWTPPHPSWTQPELHHLDTVCWISKLSSQCDTVSAPFQKGRALSHPLVKSEQALPKGAPPTKRGALFLTHWSKLNMPYQKGRALSKGAPFPFCQTVSQELRMDGGIAKSGPACRNWTRTHTHSEMPGPCLSSSELRYWRGCVVVDRSSSASPWCPTSLSTTNPKRTPFSRRKKLSEDSHTLSNAWSLGLPV